MIIVSYDIKNTKLRTKFSKYLKKFGFRLQYSVYQINNSEHVLNNIKSEIISNFENKFTESDSVIVYQLSNSCKVDKFGYAKNLDSDFIIIE